MFLLLSMMMSSHMPVVYMAEHLEEKGEWGEWEAFPHNLSHLVFFFISQSVVMTTLLSRSPICRSCWGQNVAVGSPSSRCRTCRWPLSATWGISDETGSTPALCPCKTWEGRRQRRESKWLLFFLVLLHQLRVNNLLARKGWRRPNEASNPHFHSHQLSCFAIFLWLLRCSYEADFLQEILISIGVRSSSDDDEKEI